MGFLCDFSFLAVSLVAAFLFDFLFSFSIQVLYLCSDSFWRCVFYHRIVFLLYRLTCSVRSCCPLGYISIIYLFLRSLPWRFSSLDSLGMVVFCSLMIFFINSTFFFLIFFFFFFAFQLMLWSLVLWWFDCQYLVYWKWCNFLVKESSRKKEQINFGTIVNLKNAHARVQENSRIWGKTQL